MISLVFDADLVSPCHSIFVLAMNLQLQFELQLGKDKTIVPTHGPHRHNHYVPRFMINYWETASGHHRGVFVYSLPEGRTYFEKTTTRRPYPFAIVEDLYVPLIGGRRATSMEARWLSAQETALSDLVRLAHQRTDRLARDIAEYTKISMALFTLEQRSRFNLERLRRAVEDRPELRKCISTSPEREPHRLVLENLIHLVTETHSRHWPLSLVFVYSGNGSFILTDRPGFTDPRMPERVMVLTNKVAVIYQRSEQPTFEHIDATPDFVDMVNKMVAIRARDWLVADNTALLDRWSEATRSIEAENYRRSERIGPIEPVLLLTGWSIPPDP